MPQINLSKLTPEQKANLKLKLQALASEKQEKEREKNTIRIEGVDKLVGKKGDKGDKGDRGDKGENGNDGKSGKDGKNGIDGKDGLNGKDGKDGKDFTPNLGELAINTINVLESLKDDERLDARAIKNIEKNIDVSKLGIKQFNFEDHKSDFINLLPSLPPQNAGGSGATFLKSMRDVDGRALKTASDKQVLTYNATKKLWEPGSGTGLIQWGEITGEITDQTDLVTYIDSKIATVDTLAEISALSNTAAKSLYLMTSTIPVEFRRSAGSTLLYLDETNGRVGVGTATPETPFHAFGTTFPVGLVERQVTNTNSGGSAMGVRTTSTGNMTDGFGTGFTLQIQDNAGVANPIANFFASRNGADNTGKLAINVYNAGSVVEVMTVLNDGKIGVGTGATIRSKFEVLGTGSNTVGISTSIIGLQSTANAAHQWGMRLGATSGELNLDSNFGGVDVNIVKFERGGNVGIGVTSSLGAKLHVVSTTEQLRLGYDTTNRLSVTVAATGSTTFALNGTSPVFTFSQAVLLPSGTVSAPSIGFASETNMGIYRPTTGMLAMTVGSTSLFNISSSGVAIGRGTTASSAQLHVVQASPGTGGNTIRIDATGAIGEQTGLTFFTPYAAGSLRGGRIYSVFDNTSYNDARVTIQSMTSGDTLVDTFSVKNSRVGVLTTNPLYTVHIGAGNGNFTIPNGAGGTTTPTSMLIPTSGVASYGIAVQDGTRQRRAGFFLNDTDGVWGLSYTFSSGGSAPFVLTNVTEMLRVTTTGNLGLGTGATVARKITAVSDTDASLYLRRNTTTAGNYSEILFTVSTADLYNSGIRNIRLASGFSDLLIMGQQTAGSAYANLYESVRFTYDGKLGAGTGATVSAKIHSLSITEQLRLGYDASNYLSTTISSAGIATFALTGTGTHYNFNSGILRGDSLHNNALAQGSATRQDIRSGTYTPTITGVANVSSSTARQAQWSRVGNVVTVSGQLEITATSNNTETTFGVSLPVSSDFTTAYQAGGAGYTKGNTVAGHGLSIYADATNNRAEFNYYETHGGTDTFTYTFSYEVL